LFYFMVRCGGGIFREPALTTTELWTSDSPARMWRLVTAAPISGGISTALGGTMNLGSLGNLSDLKNKATGYANQKALEMMSDVNVILAALPDAGFQIGGVDVELGATAPKLTVEVNIGQAIRQDKIKDVLAGNPNNFLLAATF